MRPNRLITIPGYAIAWPLWLVTAPLWLPLALIVDAIRRRRGIALRGVALLTVYLSFEVLGMAICGTLWIWRRLGRIDAEDWVELHFRIQAWWGATLYRAVVRLFSLRVEVESEAELGRGPYILLIQHASAGEALLAVALVSRRHGFRLRYVFKQELLWDPCLDIVGNRLPNAFVDRVSDDSAHEVLRIQALGRDLGLRDGVLIYPEGTRFSPTKKARVLERFRREGKSDLYDYASSLAFVLPPRTAGTLALLEAAPEADVVVCCHTGFEGTGSLRQLWDAALVHQRIRVRFRRIPRAEIPIAPDAQADWLRQEWKQVDAWVASHLTP